MSAKGTNGATHRHNEGSGQLGGAASLTKRLVPLDWWEYHLMLQQEQFRRDVGPEAGQLRLSYDDNRQVLTVCGNPSEVEKTSRTIMTFRQSTLETHSIEGDPLLLQILSRDTLKEHLRKTCRDNHMFASCDVNKTATRLELRTCKKDNKHRYLNGIGKTFKHAHFDVSATQQHLPKKVEAHWQDFLKLWSPSLNEYIGFRYDERLEAMHVVGPSEYVDCATDEVKEFINNMLLQKYVLPMEQYYVRFIAQHMQDMVSIIETSFAAEQVKVTAERVCIAITGTSRAIRPVKLIFSECLPTLKMKRYRQPYACLLDCDFPKYMQYLEAKHVAIIEKVRDSIKLGENESPRNCWRYVDSYVSNKKDLEISPSDEPTRVRYRRHSEIPYFRTLTAYYDIVPKCVECSPTVMKEKEDSEQGPTPYYTHASGVKIYVSTGNLVKYALDVIINSTNRTLSCNRGLSKAIVASGGTSITEELRRRLETNSNSMSEGECVITSSGRLPCKKLLHVRAPNWNVIADNEANKQSLFQAVTSCLNHVNDDPEYHSIGIPAIGSGITGIPVPEATRMIVEAVMRFLDDSEVLDLDAIHLVDINPKVSEAFRKAVSVHSESSTKWYVDERDTNWLSIYALEIANIDRVIHDLQSFHENLVTGQPTIFNVRDPPHGSLPKQGDLSQVTGKRDVTDGLGNAGKCGKDDSMSTTLSKTKEHKSKQDAKPKRDLEADLRTTLTRNKDQHNRRALEQIMREYKEQCDERIKQKARERCRTDAKLQQLLQERARQKRQAENNHTSTS